MQGDDYEMAEFAREIGDGSKQGFLEKALSIAFGPVLGMLPPPMQRKIASEESAALMSKTSRYFNGLIVPAYGLACLIAKSLGHDIDFIPGDATPLIGAISLADSGVREFMNGVAYHHFPHSKDYLKVWGEPVMSIIHSSIFGKKSTD